MSRFIAKIATTSFLTALSVGGVNASTDSGSVKGSISFNLGETSDGDTSIAASITAPFQSREGSFFVRWGMVFNRESEADYRDFNDPSHFGNRCGGGYRLPADTYHGRQTISNLWGFDIGGSQNFNDGLSVRASIGLFFQDSADVWFCDVFEWQADNEETDMKVGFGIGATLFFHERPNGNSAGFALDYHSILGAMVGVEIRF